MEIDLITQRRLVNKALDARKNAYAPYSKFCVGAALLCSDGEIFTGVNIENASYGGTICAERSAFAAAVSAGKRNFTAIAVVGAQEGKKADKPCLPCGICRQFMAELCAPTFAVVLLNGDACRCWTLGELLPEAFKL